MKVDELYIDSNNCLICGSKELSYFQAHAYDALTPSFVSITECKECTFAWQYPLNLTKQQSVEFFETAYADEGNTHSDYFIPEYKSEIAKLELDFVAKLPIEGRSILDIGAGAGNFAEIAAKNDWTVTAVDPALNIERLSNNPNIIAIKGTTDQITKGQLFDVVTLWDVIEHVPSPQKFISNITKYIKEGGWLVIETGNYKSEDRISGGITSWIYQNDHKWYFNPSSMQKMLKKEGFTDFIYANGVLRPGWNGVINYKGPSHVNLLKSIIKNPLEIFKNLRKHSDLRRSRKWEMSGMGIFTIAARKPDKAT